jgi:hypothetical protein
MYDDKNSKNHTKTATSATATRCNYAADTAETLARLRTLRLARYGRWAPLIAGYEQLVDAAIGIAEDAVADRPARLSAVKRVRAHVQLRLAGITHAPIDLDDLGSCVRVLARLAEAELRIPGLSGGAEALLSLIERASAPRPRDERDFVFVDTRTRH